MYICNHCKRNFKEKYESCPGCGGVSFSEKAYLGSTIIETPPEGGYKLDLSNFEKEKKRVKRVARFIALFGFIWLFLSAPFVFIGIVSFGAGDIISLFSSIDLLFVLAIFLGCIYYKFSSLKRINKEIARIQQLAKYGLLVKELPYKLENDGTQVMGKYLHYFIEVTYENANGSKIPLTSEIKHNINEKRFDTVDLLIDPDDYSNYYIDYEIY